RIHRIWSTDWFNRRKAEESRLWDPLQRAESPAKPKPPERAVPPPRPEPTRTTPVSVDPERPTFPYEEADFRVRSDLAPHQEPRKVQDAVRRIVDIEGPIHDEEVGRRLATVWGLERAGSRIQEVARGALKLLEREIKVRSEGAFWFSTRSLVVRARDRSEAQSGTLRKAEYLPPAEVSVAATDVLRDNVRVHVNDLVVEIARRLGFQRTGQDLQEVILKVIKSQFGKALKPHEDGSVMLMSS